jgi:hypothetical protein
MEKNIIKNIEEHNVWTTEKVESILKEYNNTGYLPQNNPFYKKNPERRAANLNFYLTKDEYVEMGKISHNILYFAENFAKTLTDEGQKIISLRKYQKKILLQFFYYRKNILLSSRQSGKALEKFSKITIKTEDKKCTVVPLFELWFLGKRELCLLDRVELYFLRKVYKLQYT